MNRSYRSVWNESLGCYVAAPETATTAARSTSSVRATRRLPERGPVHAPMALEARIVYDGAMATTVIDTSDAADTTEPTAQASAVPAPAPEAQLPLPPAATENQESSAEAPAPQTSDASDESPEAGQAAPEPGTGISDASDTAEATTATDAPAEETVTASAVPPSEPDLGACAAEAQ